MKKVNGSMTIEATMILPLVLMVFIMAMDGGIQMYEDCRDTAISIRKEEEIDVIQLFYDREILEDILQSGK